jgi:hypothetical protein
LRRFLGLASVIDVPKAAGDARLSFASGFASGIAVPITAEPHWLACSFLVVALGVTPSVAPSVRPGMYCGFMLGPRGPSSEGRVKTLVQGETNEEGSHGRVEQYLHGKERNHSLLLLEDYMRCVEAAAHQRQELQVWRRKCPSAPHHTVQAPLRLSHLPGPKARRPKCPFNHILVFQTQEQARHKLYLRHFSPFPWPSPNLRSWSKTHHHRSTVSGPPQAVETRLEAIFCNS